MVRVGFVGIGRMGFPVAARLAAAGHQVSASDINVGLAAAAVAAGMAWQHSVSELAAEVDVLFTMLPGPVECTEVMLGAGGAAGTLRPDSVWIDLTSNAPAAAARISTALAARDVQALDAPVGGGEQDAAAGTLTLFVGGDPQLLESYRPMLGVVASEVRHVGGAGAGYLVKLLINQLWFGQAVATAEVMLLAGRSGVDLTVLRDTLLVSAASSNFIRTYLPALMRGDYLPNFPIDRVVEELQAVADLAVEVLVPFSVNQSVLAVHQQALSRFGPVDGELLGVAELEYQADLTIRDSTPIP